MKSRERIRKLFETFPLSRVELRFIALDPHDYAYNILVISPDFEGIPSYDRDLMVWGFILDHFDEISRNQVKFVYTKTPEEVAEVAAPQQA